MNKASQMIFRSGSPRAAQLADFYNTVILTKKPVPEAHSNAGCVMGWEASGSAPGNHIANAPGKQTSCPNISSNVSLYADSYLNT